MPQCVSIGAPHKKLCSGDLRKGIELYDKSIVPPPFNSDQQQQDYGLLGSTKAEIVTTSKGIYLFNQMQQAPEGVPEQVTHQVTIRHRLDFLDVRYLRWVWKNGKIGNYKVIGNENLDERDEWVFFYCAFAETVGKGDTA